MIIKPDSRKDAFAKLRKGGLQKKGLSTGFNDLDDLFKLAKGYLMITTGYPSCGKSEFLDAVLVNMTLQHNWKVLYYSPENHPIEQHMSKLAEKFIGKHIMQFSNDDCDSSLDYLTKHFAWMYPENPELDRLLCLANEHHADNGLDCLVIDPWNAVTHHRGASMVHEYLSEALSKVIRFGREKEVLMSVVAHPTKPFRDKDGTIPIPTLYEISDGAMWRNKAEYGLVIHRPDLSRNQIEVYSQKVKYKWMGKVGMKKLDYNYENGRFKGLNDREFTIPSEIVAPF